MQYQSAGTLRRPRSSSDKLTRADIGLNRSWIAVEHVPKDHFGLVEPTEVAQDRSQVQPL